MSSERRDNASSNTSTEQLPGSEGGAPPPTTPDVTLLICYRDGLEAARLAPGQALVVGRREPADRRIPDRTLSREHARFTLQEGRVLVEDLGSTNGTWVAGKRIDHALIEFGGEAMLGTVLVRVLALGSAADPAIEGEEAFRRRLDDEVTRAQPLPRRSFAVLAVRANDAEAARAPAGAWAARLSANLRPADRVSLYTPNTALIVLPETVSSEALRVANAVASGPDDQGAGRLVGMAVYPEAATTPDKLVDLAREAARRAKPECPVVSASTAVLAESNVAGDGDAMIAGETLSKVLATVKRVPSPRIPILLHGETGTGKEVLARRIHERWQGQDKPFVSINCGAISSTLLVSTLFGHKKGAFTGAVQQQRGVFEEANKGCLFLDEIGELPLEAQVALLRVLDTRRVSRVGSAEEVEVDVRVIAATHRDLEAMVKEGRFREDLYYRLNTIVLKIPPLRDRKADIEPLVWHFLKQANEEQANEEQSFRIRGVAEEAMALLLAYRWPGNVRELRNAVDRAVVLAEGDLIQIDDLPPRLREEQTTTGAAPTPAAAPPPALATKAVQGCDIKARLQHLEKELIEEALQKASGNRAEAAKQLGMKLRTLARKIKDLGIPEPPER